MGAGRGWSYWLYRPSRGLPANLSEVGGACTSHIQPDDNIDPIRLPIRTYCYYRFASGSRDSNRNSCHVYHKIK
ncbi:hypothetical protein RIR_jg22535.t1 [Rhizophagus irregularis DAOM 181602=DAOM 197198]|nr:hypothetical protein RIR_jg22535.t1 [Rhizophagus irregularis DAOM 181602=DAOM 197198]